MVKAARQERPRYAGERTKEAEEGGREGVAAPQGWPGGARVHELITQLAYFDGEGCGAAHTGCPGSHRPAPPAPRPPRPYGSIIAIAPCPMRRNTASRPAPPRPHRGQGAVPLRSPRAAGRGTPVQAATNLCGPRHSQGTARGRQTLHSSLKNEYSPHATDRDGTVGKKE